MPAALGEPVLRPTQPPISPKIVKNKTITGNDDQQKKQTLEIESDGRPQRRDECSSCGEHTPQRCAPSLRDETIGEHIRQRTNGNRGDDRQPGCDGPERRHVAIKRSAKNEDPVPARARAEIQAK